MSESRFRSAAFFGCVASGVVGGAVSEAVFGERAAVHLLENAALGAVFGVILGRLAVFLSGPNRARILSAAIAFALLAPPCFLAFDRGTRFFLTVLHHKGLTALAVALLSGFAAFVAIASGVRVTAWLEEHLETRLGARAPARHRFEAAALLVCAVAACVTIAGTTPPSIGARLVAIAVLPVVVCLIFVCRARR